LHKISSTWHVGNLLLVAFSRQMFDAGYWMLDIQECTVGEIQKHRVSRHLYPGSVRIGKGFRRDGLDRI